MAEEAKYGNWGELDCLAEGVSADQIREFDGEKVAPLRIVLVKPKDQDGKARDQTGDAERHMRYAATLPIPHIKMQPVKTNNESFIIVGGGPSIKDQLPNIKLLSLVPGNTLFALNFTHTWLINRGVIPAGCVFFEIDEEPPEILASLRDDVTYYVCSHCHESTFDALKGKKVILWNGNPNSDGEAEALKELYTDELQLGGGVSTFLRSLSVGLCLGYRNFDLFGVDSSFPDDSPTTHVEGYQTSLALSDGFDLWIADMNAPDEPALRFKTASYLACQVEEFKHYCKANHELFSMRVHGDGLLPYVHRKTYPNQYV